MSKMRKARGAGTYLSLVLEACLGAMLFGACAAENPRVPPGTGSSTGGTGGADGEDAVSTAGMPVAAQSGSPGAGTSGGTSGGTSWGEPSWSGGSGGGDSGTGGGGDSGTGGGGDGGGDSGTGGGGDSGTGGGAAAGGEASPPTGDALVTANGWIDGGGNSYGIQGAWYTYCDSCDPAKPIGTSSIEPTGDNAYASTSTICASGIAGVVEQISGSEPPEYDWDGPTWGAGIGLNIGQTEGDTTPHAYDNTQGIQGFAVKLSGSVDGGTIRIKYVVAGDEATDYCKELSVPGTHSVPFSDTTASCWEGGGATPDVNSIAAVQFQVISNQTASKSFDFCVDSISVIP